MMFWQGGQGVGTGEMIVMSLMMLLFWGGLIALIVYAVRGAFVGGRQSSGQGAEQILAERFARGEIDAEEYRSRLEVLSQKR